MDRIFIAKGHGYENPSDGSGRCTAFDGFDIIAEPLPTRESRILGQIDGKAGTGCDYGSHSIKLAVRTGERAYKGVQQLYILMENGSGREVLAIRKMYDAGVTEAALLALPEPALYGMLYILWEVGSDAKREAQYDARAQWSKAFIDGRIRKSRSKGGRRRVYIETEFERDLRLGKVNSSRISISTLSGELSPA